MKFEKVDFSSISNKLYKPSKIQKRLDEFMESDSIAVRCVFSSEEYKNLKSACGSYNNAIKRYRYPICVRTIHGVMYLIKTTPCPDELCFSCNHKSDCDMKQFHPYFCDRYSNSLSTERAD